MKLRKKQFPSPRVRRMVLYMLDSASIFCTNTWLPCWYSADKAGMTQLLLRPQLDVLACLSSPKLSAQDDDSVISYLICRVKRYKARTIQACDWKVPLQHGLRQHQPGAWQNMPHSYHVMFVLAEDNHTAPGACPGLAKHALRLKGEW